MPLSRFRGMICSSFEWRDVRRPNVVFHSIGSSCLFFEMLASYCYSGWNSPVPSRRLNPRGSVGSPERDKRAPATIACVGLLRSVTVLAFNIRLINSNNLGQQHHSSIRYTVRKSGKIGRRVRRPLTAKDGLKEAMPMPFLAEVWRRCPLHRRQ